MLLTNPHTGTGRTAFEPRQVPGRSWTGGAAYPVENLRAWRFRDLVEDLMARRRCSRAAAEDEAYAMPWQPLHRCPRSPEDDTTKGDQHP